jgi:hypothetical protein
MSSRGVRFWWRWEADDEDADDSEAEELPAWDEAEEKGAEAEADDEDMLV